MAKTGISNKLSTETLYFGQLINDINAGEIKIPQFQRKFVWKDGQALELLDSVLNGYPIGSLLLWKTPEKLQAARDLGEFKLPITDEITPTNYVLDGQQRLTVIYSCLGAPETMTGYAAGYDLRSEQFVKFEEPCLPEVFPLRKTFDTTKLLNYRASLQHLPDADSLQTRLDSVITAFQQYKLPVVTLKDLSIEEVCPIFERINSSGTRLSTYDLMVAATWADNFDLNDKVGEILKSIEPKGYGNTNRSTILKSLSAIHSGSIQDKTLRELRQLDTKSIEYLTDRTKNALKKSVDVLHTQFGIHNWDFLSYEAIILIVTHIFDEIKELTPDQTSRLRQWFWRSSFGERYKIGGENFVSKDLANVKDFVLHNNGKCDDFGAIPSPGDWRSISFKSNVSRSRAFILALASKHPRNLFNGTLIDVDDALSHYNKKEYHHVYPRAFLARSKLHLNSNALTNLIMITSSSNKAISDRDPIEYLPSIAKSLGSESDNVFGSNLLPLPSNFDYAKATYADFLATRGEILTSYIEKDLARI